jgi:hypothetical protein
MFKNIDAQRRVRSRSLGRTIAAAAAIAAILGQLTYPSYGSTKKKPNPAENSIPDDSLANRNSKLYAPLGSRMYYCCVTVMLLPVSAAFSCMLVLAS